MAKGTKLSEFEKQKRVGKYQREILKAFGRSKTVIYNWKFQISMEQENWLAEQKNYHHNSREELFVK